MGQQTLDGPRRSGEKVMVPAEGGGAVDRVRSSGVRDNKPRSSEGTAVHDAAEDTASG